MIRIQMRIDRIAFSRQYRKWARPTGQHIQITYLIIKRYIICDLEPPDLQPAFYFPLFLLSKNMIKIKENINLIQREPDTQTQELSIDGNNIGEIAIIALVNCPNLRKLKINGFLNQKVQTIKKEGTNLEELEICGDANVSFIQEVMRSSFTTLRSLRIQNCYSINLQALNGSNTLKQLSIDSCTHPEIISTFKSLLELEVQIEALLQMKEQFQMPDQIVQSIELPKSVKHLKLKNRDKPVSYNQLKFLIEMNPNIQILTIPIPEQRYEIAYFLKKYKHIKFHFSFQGNYREDPQLFTFQKGLSYIQENKEQQQSTIVLPEQ